MVSKQFELHSYCFVKSIACSFTSTVITDVASLLGSKHNEKQVITLTECNALKIISTVISNMTHQTEILLPHEKGECHLLEQLHCQPSCRIASVQKSMLA